MKVFKRGNRKSKAPKKTATPEIAAKEISTAIKNNVRKDAGRSERTEVTSYRRESR